MRPGPRSLTEAAADRLVRWLDRIAEDGLVRMAVRRVRNAFGHQLVKAKLLPGEPVIKEVTHSGVSYVPGGLIALLGLLLVVRWVPFVETRALWFAALVSFGVLAWGVYKILYVARDRFVITDSRVFRVYGVESLREAEMEIGRVLDITVLRPWWLRPFRSGHLVLENAAQQQGLKDIRFVPQPELLAKEIHRLRREVNAAGRARLQLGATLRGLRTSADHPAAVPTRGVGRRRDPRRL
ncbi:MAG TPA: PH domain-containing protein [Jiangellales bacterium]|nr:PH domain-containing protein [Jiangellales bacterium]